MAETLDGRPRLGEISESGVDEYKPLSGLAVTGLIVGLLSLLAFVGPLLYIFAIAGVVLNTAALVRIGTGSPAITGRKLALAGLVLSTLCISIAPSHRLASRHLLRKEARQFASVWFRFLAENEPRKAHQLTRAPGQRLSLDEQLADEYAKDGKMAEELGSFTKSAAVRSLLDAGSGARIQSYEIQFEGRQSGDERIDLLCSFSFEEEGREETGFVGLEMRRVADAGNGRADWYISNFQDDVPPEGMSR